MWANIIKIVLGLALLGLALSQVQWRDSLDEVDAAGAVLARHSGQVVRLDRTTVWLRLAGEAMVRPFALEQAASRHLLRLGLRSLIGRVSMAALGAASGLYLLAIVLASWRWWWLLRLTHLPLGFGRVLRLTWVGLFFNNFLPGQTGGDVAKGLYLLKACPQARAPAVGSLVLDRVLGLLSLLLLALLALLSAQTGLSNALQSWVWGLFLGGSALLGLLLSRRVRGFARQHLRSLLPRFVRLGSVETSLLLYRRQWSALLGCFSLGLLNQICVIFGVALLGRALGLDVPWAVFFVLLPLLFLIGALPLAPNGWGVGELSFGYLFAAYGASFSLQGEANPTLFYTQGVALSVLFRLLMLAWSLPGGLFWLYWRHPGDVSQAWAVGGRAHG